MDQLERIMYMEKLLDEASEAVSVLTEALQRYCSIQKTLQELEVYYTSCEWRRDFDDDNAGKFPVTLKRGVLSEDAIHHLLEQNTHLLRVLHSGSLPKMAEYI